MQGASTLIATMKANGALCWLVSGGFSFFAKRVAERMGFDAYFSNELIERGGVLMGEVALPILDKAAKKDKIALAQQEMGIEAFEVLALGDGANDLPMLMEANAKGGLGVAFRAKPKVRDAVPWQINLTDLRALLFAQGYAKADFVEG